MNISGFIQYCILKYHESYHFLGKRRGATSMLEVIVIFVFDVRQSVWFVLENAIWEILHYFLETPLFSSVLFFAWKIKKEWKKGKSTSLFMHSGFSKCTLQSVAPGCYNLFLSSNKAFDRKTIEQFSHTCQEDRFWSILLANKDYTSFILMSWSEAIFKIFNRVIFFLE